MLVDIASGSQRNLTYDRRGVSFPRWSPAGDRLAFLSLDNSPKPQTQIFIMPMTGGDPLQVTKAPAGVQQYAWRPDGRMIAYAASDEARKRTGEEKFNDSFEVGNNDFLVTSAPLPAHLWVIGADGRRSPASHLGYLEPAHQPSAELTRIAAVMVARW